MRCSLGNSVIPQEAIQTIARAVLPCFVYDAPAIRQRAAGAASLVDRYFYPVKACPEPAVVRSVLTLGCGLDLCSEGDIRIADAVGCPGANRKFTSPCADDALLRRLRESGATLDADSLEQALSWGRGGGTACGLRIAAPNAKALYGAKFGVPAGEVAEVARRLAAVGVRLDGLHVHDQHTHLTPAEFAARLADTFSRVDREVLRRCRYVNLGGSWPMRHGNPASLEDLRSALNELRERCHARGFQGALYAEPGRWVVGPCGYWAARVAAVKPHPKGGEHRVVILDSNAPVPCRPSLARFVVLRDGIPLDLPRSRTCDLFGAANTALDSIGEAVRLPALAAGDVLVSLGQGAYTRSLIPPFNERERPVAIVLGG